MAIPPSVKIRDPFRLFGGAVNSCFRGNDSVVVLVVYTHTLLHRKGLSCGGNRCAFPTLLSKQPL